MSRDLEVNKKNAIAFYRKAYLGDPSGAVEDYVGAEYIQHNPLSRMVSRPSSITSAKWPGTTLLKALNLYV